MQDNKLYYYLFLLSALILSSCKSPEPFKHKTDLIGYWKGRTVDITTPSRMNTSFAFRKYGTAFLIIDSDSSFNYTVSINNDVVMKKNVLGNTAEKVILKSGYTSFRKGKYTATDSTILFYDPNKVIISEEKYFFEGRTLFTRHSDKDKNIWLIAWEKEN